MIQLSIRTDAASLEPPPLIDKEDPAEAKWNTVYTVDDQASDVDSLFDEPMDASPVDIMEGLESLASAYVEPRKPIDITPASRLGPSISGLHFDPSILLPDELAETLLQKCIDLYFQDKNVNQVMLFERVVTRSNMSPDSSEIVPECSGLPIFLKDLLCELSNYLHPLLPTKTHELLFPLPGSPPCARQAIVNFYRPGEGITPHIDLLDRFGDGIIGVSLGSGCVMRFTRAMTVGDNEVEEKRDGQDGWSVFLPHGSIYVMSEEARYSWTHGIDGRKEDWVQDRVGATEGRWVMRSIRVSITFRWLLPGADVVGGLPDAQTQY